MGLFNRFRTTADKEPWRPPVPGTCQCPGHVDALADQVIEADPPVKVKELVAEVTVEPTDQHFLYGEVTGQRRGPFEWRLTYTPAIARLVDSDAPASIDDMLFIQDGIENLMRLDESTVAIGASQLCDQGITAAMFQALANPRVRKQN